MQNGSWKEHLGHEAFGEDRPELFLLFLLFDLLFVDLLLVLPLLGVGEAAESHRTPPLKANATTPSDEDHAVADALSPVVSIVATSDAISSTSSRDNQSDSEGRIFDRLVF